MADLLSEITLREQWAYWVENTYHLKTPTTAAQFLKDLTAGTAQVASNTVKPVVDGKSILAIQAPDGVNVLVAGSGFDFSLGDYKDPKLLYDLVMQQMRKSICHFSYEMVSSGRVREAYGTLSENLIPPGKNVNGIKWGVRDLNTAQTYWDLEAKDYRSFVPALLITKV